MALFFLNYITANKNAFYEISHLQLNRQVFSPVLTKGTIREKHEVRLNYKS